MKYLGIDYGHKKVGFAESDELGMLAFPMMISHNDDNLMRDTLEIIKAMNFGAIVIGESLDLNGKPNKIVEEVKTFAKELEEKCKELKLNIGINFEKEWLTTVEARRQPEAKRDVDDSAAALILQRYLDKINPKKFESAEDDDVQED